MSDNTEEVWITTISGKKFCFLDPDPDTIDIQDIAYALARLPRWGGHTKIDWSVAQHSIVVARLAPSGLELEGLLHDATEAYMGDLVRPLKKLLPDYSKIEDRLYSHIAKKFGLLDPIPSEIKQIDDRVGATEAKYIMRSPGAGWLYTEKADDSLRPLLWSDSRSAVVRSFLSFFDHLTAKR